MQKLEQENAALRQQLGLAPAPAAGAGASSSAAARPAAAAAAPAAPLPKSDEVYLLGGVEDRGEAGDDNSWLSTVLVYSPRSYSWRQGAQRVCVLRWLQGGHGSVPRMDCCGTVLVNVSFMHWLAWAAAALGIQLQPNSTRRRPRHEGEARLRLVRGAGQPPVSPSLLDVGAAACSKNMPSGWFCLKSSYGNTN